ncbi:MAG TPA: phosphoribosylaminoimidazolesuccinocarboxamide synthase [Verrucomicrobiae bacterium]|nr:phosphoribosylaminoimidazolesuccinocarboxamide synthase [Verrucomicrobiae bacterium]
MANTITQIDIPGIKKLKSGKVREVFDLGDSLLFVATDRISAFDVILPNPIPEKGRVLTALSEFWFGKTRHIVENHFITSDLAGQTSRLPKSVTAVASNLQGRAMLVRKCQPLPVECVVRGYLAGSGLKEYKQSRTVCGIKLSDGLVESSQLPHPIFTPATKEETGHDENIDFERCVKILGKSLAEKVRDISLALYSYARDYAATRGIIIADTKFEFGLLECADSSALSQRQSGDKSPQSKLVLIDEALTPDSSRFWPADSYAPGKPQPSFDKQFVRDYLETLDWDKTPPGPVLPDAVIRKTTEKYVEALKRLTT